MDTPSSPVYNTIVTPPGLLNDVIFKIVFGTPQNTSVLRALLNALLGLSGSDRIIELEILNPMASTEYVLDRGVILDVKSRDAQGRLYNIEVQVAREPDYINRSVYYLARLFSEQLSRGEPYSEIARTVAISLLDYLLFEDVPDLHSIYRFYDKVHDRQLSDILEIHYIELIKFQQNKPNSLRTPFEKWLHVLKFGDLYESEQTVVPEALVQEEGIDMALKSMRRAYASDEVREIIEARLKAQRDEASRLEHATQQGVQQGVQETEQRIARRMMEQGVDSAIIFHATGLRPDQF